MLKAAGVVGGFYGATITLQLVARGVKLIRLCELDLHECSVSTLSEFKSKLWIVHSS